MSIFGAGGAFFKSIFHAEKDVSQRKTDILECTAQNFRLRRSKTLHLYEGKVSNARWNTMRNVSNPTRTYAPTLQVGEEDGLKLKKKDLSISPIRKGGGVKIIDFQDF